jgi:hypothetical protein
MASSGYSGTPLLKKLGIKEEMKILLLHAPADYMQWLEADIHAHLCKKNEVPDLVHVFATTEKIFLAEMEKLKPVCRQHTHIIIWVSWYKKSSGMATDITEDTIRNYALANDLVDVKVCAVSDAWSGLKLVVPVSKR